MGVVVFFDVATNDVQLGGVTHNATTSLNTTHTHIHHTIGVILGFQALIEQGHGLRTSVRSYIRVEKCSVQSWLNTLT